MEDDMIKEHEVEKNGESDTDVNLEATNDNIDESAAEIDNEDHSDMIESNMEDAPLAEIAAEDVDDGKNVSITT